MPSGRLVPVLRAASRPSAWAHHRRSARGRRRGGIKVPPRLRIVVRASCPLSVAAVPQGGSAHVSQLFRPRAGAHPVARPRASSLAAAFPPAATGGLRCPAGAGRLGRSPRRPRPCGRIPRPRRVSVFKGTARALRALHHLQIILDIRYST